MLHTICDSCIHHTLISVWHFQQWIGITRSVLNVRGAVSNQGLRFLQVFLGEQIHDAFEILD